MFARKYKKRKITIQASNGPSNIKSTLKSSLRRKHLGKLQQRCKLKLDKGGQQDIKNVLISNIYIELEDNIVTNVCYETFVHSDSVAGYLE